MTDILIQLEDAGLGVSLGFKRLDPILVTLTEAAGRRGNQVVGEDALYSATS